MQGTIVVPPGCTATNLSHSLETMWQPCEGPVAVKRIMFAIRERNARQFIYQGTHIAGVSTMEEPLGTLNRLTLGPGTYDLLLDSGRNTTVTLSYSLSCLKGDQKAIPGDVIVSLRATDKNGHPVGPNLTIGTIDGNTLTTLESGEWREIAFNASYNVVSGTKYAIVVSAPSRSGLNAIKWLHDEAGTYAGGNRESSANSGFTWGSDLNSDYLFEIYSSAPSPTAAGNLHERYNTGDDAGGDVRWKYWHAQTFTAGSSYSVGSIKLKVYRLASSKESIVKNTVISERRR